MNVPADIETGSNGQDDKASWSERYNSQGPEWKAKGEAELVQGNPDGTIERKGGNVMTIVKAEGDDLTHSDGKTAQKAIELIKKHILSKLRTTRVSLQKPMEFDGKMGRASMEFGICASEKCFIDIVGTYSVSHEVKVTRLDGVECGKFILFCSTNKSIDTILKVLNSRIARLVNKSYSDDELIGKQKEYSKRFFKGVDFKTINNIAASKMTLPMYP